MKYYFVSIALLFQIYGKSQTVLYSDCDHPVAHDWCKDAPSPSLCELDGFRASTLTFTDTNDPVDDKDLTAKFCGEFTDTHDNMWIKFVADANIVTFYIEIIHCLGNEVSKGIQVAIAETDCQNNYKSLACSNCGEEKTVSATVIPGNTYYLMIDGCYFDICEFIIHVKEGIAGSKVDIDIPQAYLCEGNTTTLVANPTPSNRDYTYQWYTFDGEILSNSKKKSIEIKGIGDYYVEVYDKENCCGSSQLATVELDPTTPIASASILDSLNCKNTEAILSGSYENIEGQKYNARWRSASGIPIGHSSTEAVTKPGTYYYIVKNVISHCIDTQVVEVIQDTLAPISNPELLGAINCKENQTISLFGENSTPQNQLLFYWIDQNGDTISTDPNIEVDTSFLEYRLSVIDTTNGCEDLQIVEIPDDRGNPIAYAGDDKIIDCNIDKVEISGNAEIGSSISGNLSYQWIDSNGEIISTESSFTTDDEGVYTLLVTNIDSGCTALDEVEVTNIIKDPEIEIAQPQIITCDEPEVLLDASASLDNGNYNLEWFNSTGDQLGTENQILVSESGTYTLSALNPSNGCISYETVKVEEDNSTPTNINTYDGEIDCNYGSVTLIGTVSESNSEINFVWTNETNEIVGNESELSVSDEGIYTLTVTLLSTGCTVSKDAIATSNVDIPNGSILPEGNTLNCLNQSLVIQGVSTTPNTTLKWEGPNINEISPEITVTEPGIYTLSITNTENGCIRSLEIEIFEDLTPPEAEIPTPKIINCSNESVLLQAEIMDIENMYFSWSTSNGNIISESNIQNPLVDKAGNYFLTIVNKNNNCESIFEIIVEENYEKPIIDAGPEMTFDCNLLSVEIGNTTNSDYTYEWRNSNGETVGIEEKIQINNPDTYTLVATDLLSGCTTQDEITILQNIETPDIEIENILTLLDCNNPSLNLSSITSIANPVLEWSGVNGFSTNTNEVTITESGEYLLSITNPLNGCTNETSIEITENFETPNISIIDPDILNCKIDSVLLSTINTDNVVTIEFEWTNNQGINIGNDKNVMVSEPGSYHVITTNTINGCTSKEDIIVNQNLINPDVNAGDNQIMDCETQYVQLQASATSQNVNNDIKYEWRIKGVVIGTEESIEASQIGVYTVSVIDNENGCKDSDELEIKPSQDAPDAISTISNPITCKDETAIIDGTESSLFDGSSGNLSYEWYFEGQLISSEKNLEISQSGNYQLIVRDDSNGCSDNSEVEAILDIEKPALPQIEPDTLTCTTLSIQIDGSLSENETYLYSWLDKDKVSISNTKNIEISEIGTYTLVIENENNGCWDEISFSVPENKDKPIANIEVNDELDCSTNEVFLFAENSTIDNTTFNWVGEGIQQTANPLQPKVTQAGTYQLVVTNNENGCKDTTEAIVIEIENDLLARMVSEDENCIAENNGLIEIVDIEGGTPPYQYSLNDSIFSNEIIYEGLAPGNYEMQIQDARGCLFSETLFISAWIPPTLELGPDITVSLGESVSINPQYQNIEVDQFLWNHTELEGENPSFQPIEETEVVGTIINNLGCEIQDQLRIFIDLDYPIYIPNAFTPNNDGINDVFMVFSKYKAVKEISTMQIFDRWGEMVFENYNFLPNEPRDGWDGLIGGKEMQPAVFGYYIQVEFINGEKKLYKGDLTLIL